MTEFILVELGTLLTTAFALLSLIILSKVDGCEIVELSFVCTVASSGSSRILLDMICSCDFYTKSKLFPLSFEPTSDGGLACVA